MVLWLHCHPGVVVSGASLQLSGSLFFSCSRWCIFLSCISVSIPSVTRATLYVPSARARPQVFLLPEKAASVKRLDAVLGKVNLPNWCFIVVRHGGNAHRGVYCLLPLRRIAADQTRFSRSRRLESSLHTIDPLRHFSYSLWLLSAGVAPLPPRSRKILDETVKTFAVFPSWMYLLDGDDNCMLSVPFSTSDLHFRCWQSANLPSDGCRSFHVTRLRIVVFSQRRMLSFLLCLDVLHTRCLLHDSRLLGLTLRPSAPVCRCHRDSLTRGRMALAQEAVRGPPPLSPCLVLHLMTCAR